MIRDCIALVALFGIVALVLAIPECPTEDSANCYWHSSTGASFVDINGKVVTLWNN